MSGVSNTIAILLDSIKHLTHGFLFFCYTHHYIHHFYKWWICLFNHFHKRLSNARRAYSYYPIYRLKLLQLAGHSICLVVTRHFSFMSSKLSSIMSSRAKRLSRDIKLSCQQNNKARRGYSKLHLKHWHGSLNHTLSPATGRTVTLVRGQVWQV